MVNLGIECGKVMIKKAHRARARQTFPVDRSNPCPAATEALLRERFPTLMSLPSPTELQFALHEDVEAARAGR